MDILIKGMEMPQQMESPITITIFKNGSVWMNDVTFGKGKLPNAKAVAIPEHGDLIDRKALSDAIDKVITDRDRMIGTYDTIEQIIDEAETIVEATNG